MTASIKLQKNMVINKGKKLPLKLKMKSGMLDLITWALWFYIVTFVIRYAKHIIDKPVINGLFFMEVVMAMFFVALTLVGLTYLWSLVSTNSRR